MLEGISFIAIVTAAITSTFVTRAAQERSAAARTPTRRAGLRPGSTSSRNNSTGSSR